MLGRVAAERSGPRSPVGGPLAPKSAGPQTAAELMSPAGYGASHGRQAEPGGRKMTGRTVPRDRILVVNAGSSSLKLRVLGPADEVTAAFDLDQWDGRPEHTELGQFLTGLSVDAVGHRVVHGGSRFIAPTVIDDTVTAAIGDLTDLAPLHQPRALAGIAAVRAALPSVAAVACFDTAFHAGLPAAAAAYALPAAWT